MAKGIVINISGSGEGAAEALRQIEARMQETADKGRGMSETLAAAGERVKTAFEMMGIGIGAREALEGLKSIIEGTMEAAVQLGHLSQQTGISVQNLSALKYAAAETGVDFEVLTRGFKKLAVTVYEADTGNKTAAKGFTQLGISAEELSAKGNDMYAVMGLLSQKFAAMPEGIAKSDTAAKIFGARMGSEMIPILNQLGSNMDELRGKAQAMGLVWDEAGIRKMEELHQKSQELKGTFEGLGMTITSALAPALEKLAQLIPQVLGIGGQGAHGNDFAAGIIAIDDWADSFVHAIARVNYAIIQFNSPGKMPSFDSLFPGKYGSMRPGAAPSPFRDNNSLIAYLRQGSSGGGGESGGGSSAGGLDRAAAEIQAKWERTYHLTAGIVQHMHEMVADAKELNEIEGQKSWDKLQADAQSRVDQQFKAKAPNVGLHTDMNDDPLGPAKRQIVSAEEMAQESSRVIGGFLDQLSEQALQGKMNFKSLVDSALSELERWVMGVMERQWIIPMLNSMFGVAGAGMGVGSDGMSTFNGQMAGGGELGGNGDWAIVGDSPAGDMSNAELFAPKGPGTVLPHDVLAGIAAGKGGGGGAPHVSVNVINNSSAQVKASPAGVSFDAQARQFVIHTVLEDMNQGGPLAGAMSGFAPK
jgi:hypothetical protein